jgi:biotin operon repressor
MSNDESLTQKIYELIKNHPEGISAPEIGHTLGIHANQFTTALNRLRVRGEPIVRKHIHYFLETETSSTPAISKPFVKKPSEFISSGKYKKLLGMVEARGGSCPFQEITTTLDMTIMAVRAAIKYLRARNIEISSRRKTVFLGDKLKKKFPLADVKISHKKEVPQPPVAPVIATPPVVQSKALVEVFQIFTVQEDKLKEFEAVAPPQVREYLKEAVIRMTKANTLYEKLMPVLKEI